MYINVAVIHTIYLTTQLKSPFRGSVHYVHRPMSMEMLTISPFFENFVHSNIYFSLSNYTFLLLRLSFLSPQIYLELFTVDARIGSDRHTDKRVTDRWSKTIKMVIELLQVYNCWIVRESGKERERNGDGEKRSWAGVNLSWWLIEYFNRGRLGNHQGIELNTISLWLCTFWYNDDSPSK